MNNVSTAANASSRTLGASARRLVRDRAGVAVGSGGRIFETKDGGRTWRAQQTEVTGDSTTLNFRRTRRMGGGRGHLLHTTEAAHTGVVSAARRTRSNACSRGAHARLGGRLRRHIVASRPPPRRRPRPHSKRPRRTRGASEHARRRQSCALAPRLTRERRQRERDNDARRDERARRRRRRRKTDDG